MSQDPFDFVDNDTESSDIQLQLVASSSSPNEANRSPHLSISEDEPDNDFGDEFERRVEELVNWDHFKSNTKALAARFVQLVRRSEQLAPLILDVYSLSLSIFLNKRQPEVDFLYPMSSLKKRQSGRLARLILEYSRDLQQPNIHDATSSQEDADPPRVAVINLAEVPRDVIERGYSVPADVHGFVVMLIIFQSLLALCLHIFIPINVPLAVGEWATSLFSHLFGEQHGASAGHVVSLAWGIALNWLPSIFSIAAFYGYAVIRGDGVLALVRKSSPSTPASGYAIFLDRDFTVILTGSQSVVESIAESNFSISHPISREIHQKGWQMVQHVCYEILKASCRGILFASIVGCWILLHRPSRLVSYALVIIMSFLSSDELQEHPDPSDSANAFLKLEPSTIKLIRFVLGILPSTWLLSIYELAVAKSSLAGLFLDPMIPLHYIPMIPFIILLVSSRDFPIRTAKLVNILGNPPVRRWGFDTLAAAATFQCLVLCRDVPRPIKTIDVFTLLDVIVPDQTDLWRVWKRRVADRITHEVEISFAPTLPSFGDQRQKHLKELLDQAQLGYREFRDFYDWHVPLYSTELEVSTVASVS